MAVAIATQMIAKKTPYRSHLPVLLMMNFSPTGAVFVFGCGAAAL